MNQRYYTTANSAPRVLPLILALTMCMGVCARAAENERTLTLSQSVSLAVQNNVTVRLAKAQTQAARARAAQAAAELLPQLMGSVSEQRTYRVNLDAMGFEGYGFLGPYNTFDARITLVQELFNLTTYERRNSQKQKEESARLREELAAEQVAGAAALAYTEVLRSEAALKAAQADERLAQELLNLAQERHSAGTATGLDVAREQTRVAQDHSRVLYAQVTCDDAGLRLRHITGLPLDEKLKLDDTLTVADTAFPDADTAIADALRDRLELAIGRAEMDAADYALSAAHSRHLPEVAVAGSFGLSGNELDSKAGSVSDLGIKLKMPIFTGGAVTAAGREAEAARSETTARLDDMGVQVREDVRISLKRIAAAVEQVTTAETAEKFATSELAMAQGRFAAGVGDNVELVNAQTSLSLARSTKVAALAQYNNSKINFALAQGHMRAYASR